MDRVSPRPNWGRVPGLPPAYAPQTRRITWGDWSKGVSGRFFDRACPDLVVKFVPANDLDGYWW